MFTIKKTKKFTFLKSKIKNKDILHVGCLGIVKKIEIENEKNNYLHKFLNDNSNKCYGLDIDKNEIEYLRSNGFNNLYLGNAEKIDEINFDTKFDLILLGNMFNYFPNPGILLEKTTKQLKENGTIIITIENYITLKTILKYILFGRYPGFYHHCFSVNKNSLANLILKSGFEICDYGYFFEGPDNFLRQSMRSKIANFLTQLFPNSEKYADGYIIEIKKTKTH